MEARATAQVPEGSSNQARQPIDLVTTLDLAEPIDVVTLSRSSPQH